MALFGLFAHHTRARGLNTGQQGRKSEATRSKTGQWRKPGLEGDNRSS